jgi:hypothetical protein
MQLKVLKDGAWEMGEMRELELHLLSSVAVAADTSGHEKARQRLFPDRATTEGEDTTGAGDWKEFVVPGLERAFKDAVEVVNGDLAAVERTVVGGEEIFRVKVPVDHTEHWYSALNQARLVLTEKYDLPASEDEFLDASAVFDDRWLAGAQSHLYAVIQTFLLEAVMGREAP